MASTPAKEQKLFINEVQRHQARYRKLIQFTHSSTKAAGAMLLAAVVALIVANTGAYEAFLGFWHTEVGVFFGDGFAGMSLGHVINDIFMAIFFLLVGLEVKYELTVGELTNIRQALLPIVAAVGGVLAPIGIYLAFNATNPETAHGWGVPTATDIAFALGILALLGNRVPNGVRVFLSTLAVADDIIASGDSILDLAYNLKRRKAKRVFAGATFAFFTSGLEAFDKAYAEGMIDHVFATNLTYTPKEVLERPWFSQADMSKYMAFVIATLNHDQSLSYLLNPWNRIEKLLTKYRADHPVED